MCVCVRIAIQMYGKIWEKQRFETYENVMCSFSFFFLDLRMLREIIVTYMYENQMAKEYTHTCTYTRAII